jgi:polysaccharide deacetylase 2 family uncharacterized protein YibQ
MKRTGTGGWFAFFAGAVLAPQLFAASDSPPGAAPGASLLSYSTTAAAATSRFASGVARGHALMRESDEPAPPAAPVYSEAVIAIILDDLGSGTPAGLRAIGLPGPVACAFLPDAPHTRAQAELAFARGKEVMLHLPMEPLDHGREYPASLTLATARDPLVAYLRTSLAAVPHARGVNNHQGSELTADEQHMGWVMAELHAIGGLYFVDSRTTADSVAFRAARAWNVPSTERDVFLDVERGAPAVRAAFHKLVEQARRNGAALGIGHPYPEVFAVLEQELPQLTSQGITLVSPSALIARQYGEPKPGPSLTVAAAPCASTGDVSSCSMTPATSNTPRAVPVSMSTPAH